MIVDLAYASEIQKGFCKALEEAKGINYQEERFNIPMELILNLHSELAHLYLGMQIKTVKKVILNDLSSVLNKISDIAIFLNIDLVVEIEEVQTTAPEVTLNALFNHVSMLNYKKAIARNKLINRIIPLFVELVYSLGFNLDELKEAYHFKMGENYLRFI